MDPSGRCRLPSNYLVKGPVLAAALMACSLFNRWTGLIPPVATPSTEPTSVPTAIAAGLVAPEVELIMDARVEDIQAGEYALIYPPWQPDDSGEHRFFYYSLSDKVCQRLFRVAPRSQERASIRILSVQFPKVYLGLNKRPLLDDEVVSLDLATQEVVQFRVGEKDRCRGPRESRQVSSRFLTYDCFAEDSGVYKYFVSLEDWRTVGRVRLAPRLWFDQWVKPDVAIFSSDDQTDEGKFTTCRLAAPSWEPVCWEAPYRLGGMSPDGAWAWVIPARPPGAPSTRLP